MVDYHPYENRPDGAFHATKVTTVIIDEMSYAVPFVNVHENKFLLRGAEPDFGSLGPSSTNFPTGRTTSAGQNLGVLRHSPWGPMNQPLQTPDTPDTTLLPPVPPQAFSCR